LAKKTMRVRRTIKRGNVRRPSDTGETIDALEARLVDSASTGVAHITRRHRWVDRKYIKVAEKAFQWRVPKRNLIPSDDHILTLARAIQRGDEMPPILVFPVGELLLMDGHHRLQRTTMRSGEGDPGSGVHREPQGG